MSLKDYIVTIEVSVTAPTPERAMQFALQDLRDRTIGPWNGDVREVGQITEPKTVSAA